MVRWILAAGLTLCAAGPAHARDEALKVAAASNLKPAMDELAKAFEAARPGARVRITAGGSGAFFAQIREGAPFDVFFSADREYPAKLVQAGLTEGGDVVYAVGRLAVWVPKTSLVDVEREGLAALGDPRVRKVAIANPGIAPYGRAAQDALRRAGVLAAVEPKLVLGQNVSQAAQFARSGAADAAILPSSLARAPALAELGRIVTLPSSAHAPIEQSAVVLKRCRQPALARAFLAFVRSEAGRAILERHGYEPS